MLDEQTQRAAARVARPGRRRRRRPAARRGSARASTSRRASAAMSSRSCARRAPTQRLYLGASPRAGIALLRVAKARALSDGREYVTPDDVKAVAAPVLAHRLILGAGGSLGRRSAPRSSSPTRSRTPRFPSDDGRGVEQYSRSASSAGSSRSSSARRRSIRSRPGSCSPSRSRSPGCGSPCGSRACGGAGGTRTSSSETTSGSSSCSSASPAFRCRTSSPTNRSAGSATQEVELRAGRRGFHSGSYRLHDVPRGRHRFEPLRLSIADPFGLAETTPDARRASSRSSSIPRLVELDRLFFDGGAGAEHGRRLLLRRPVGFDLHSVRDYQQGESLRRVHWPSTARRGALMVKELEDSPRDEVAVLLDGDPAAVAGASPDSSFDVAVRVAGSILRAQVQRGRRCVLVLNTAGREMQAVSSDGPEWQRALELLAAAEPDAHGPGCVACCGRRMEPAARALELVVVTSRDRVVARRPAARARAHAPPGRARPRRARELRRTSAPARAGAAAPAGGGRADRRRAAGRRPRERARRRGAREAARA